MTSQKLENRGSRRRVKVFQSLANTDLTKLLKTGTVGVLPTDTVYGLVASVLNRKAVERLYALKHRDQKPGTTIAASIEQLIQLGIDPDYLAQAAALWPNPISVVMKSGKDYWYIHQGKGDSPFRIVGNKMLVDLLRQTGPLLTTSANQEGRRPASNLTEAQNYFGDQVDFYVDGGSLGERPPSTIIQYTGNGKFRVIRQGAVVVGENGKTVRQ